MRILTMERVMQRLTYLFGTVVLLAAGCTRLAPTEPAPLPEQLPVLETNADPTLYPSTPTNPPSASPVKPTDSRTEPGTDAPPGDLFYAIVDSGQAKCYDASREITCSQGSFYGQDAQYAGNTPSYRDNGDGTVSDLVTGLTWQQDPGEKTTYARALAGAKSFSLAGYDDWRLPTIKELYSLILFDGTDVSVCSNGTCTATPFIDTRYFRFRYGDIETGERAIDSQFVSSTKYVSTTMGGAETVFGVNFADGRIKGYGLSLRGKEKTFFVLYVRGNPQYGQNDFAAENNSAVEERAVLDRATGLTWMQTDSGKGMDWKSALDYCETLSYAGADDWRLPNAKELESIVDYSRSPDTTNSPALDPLFEASPITNEAGQTDFPVYWSSTTHTDSSGRGNSAAYLAFGRALGYMRNAWLDVHGAGAQRSDPKTGSASNYPQGHGPQGDAVRVENYVRCVRGGDVRSLPEGIPGETRPSMSVESNGIQLGGPQNSVPQQGGGAVNGRTPPQESLDACSGKAIEAPCSFRAPNRTVTGTCRLIQGITACVPADAP